MCQRDILVIFDFIQNYKNIILGYFLLFSHLFLFFRMLISFLKFYFLISWLLMNFNSILDLVWFRILYFQLFEALGIIPHQVLVSFLLYCITTIVRNMATSELIIHGVLKRTITTLSKKHLQWGVEQNEDNMSKMFSQSQQVIILLSMSGYQIWDVLSCGVLQ